MIILIMLCMSPTLEVKIDDVGLYDPYSIETIWSVDGKYLLCSKIGHKLVLINKHGKIENVYDKKGEGPGELKKPRILNITDEKIYTYNSNGSIVEFDHYLKQGVSSSLPPYPMNTSYSWPILGDNKKSIVYSYITFPMGNDHLVVKNEVDDDKWKVVGKYFEQKKPIPIRGKYYKISEITFDGKYAFYSPQGFDEPYYEIYVHDFSSRRDDLIVAALAQEVDAKELNRSGNYLYFDRASVNKNGYILEISYMHNKEWTYIHDYYDKEGKFRKRVSVGENVKMIPVQNSDEIFIFRDLEEGPVLELFHPQM